MGVIRDKMAADLALRRVAPLTAQTYLRYAGQFAAHFRRPVRELGEREVRGFLSEMMAERHWSASTHAVALASIGFLYRVTLRRPGVVAGIPFPRVRSRLPEVLSPAEVARVIAQLRTPRQRMLAELLYATGLRISEALALRCGDIDATRNVIVVQRGKGGRERQVPLGKGALLGKLRTYWKQYRPKGDYLFASSCQQRPMMPHSFWSALRKAARRAGLRKRVSAHVLRHSFATNGLERGENLRMIQVVLGHARLTTTARYLRVAPELIGRMRTPLDLLAESPHDSDEPKS